MFLYWDFYAFINKTKLLIKTDITKISSCWLKKGMYSATYVGQNDVGTYVKEYCLNLTNVTFKRITWLYTALLYKSIVLSVSYSRYMITQVIKKIELYWFMVFTDGWNSSLNNWCVAFLYMKEYPKYS